jgi:hypothetical protein
MNVGVALALAAIFLIGRSRLRAPAKLNLKFGFRKAEQAMQTLQKAVGDYEPHVKNLNVVFMYNGHTWDAYEVLGVPAGSKIEAVKEAYLQALLKVDGESRAFIEAAYRAIVS